MSSTDNARLRVAHIITQLELGGAQRNTIYTVEHLDPERFEPFLLSGRGGMLDEELKLLGNYHFFIPTLVRPIRPFKDLRALIAMYRYLHHLQPDIVHTHSSKAGILGRIAAYFAGVPVIIHTYHGFGFTPRQRPFVRRFLIQLEKICAWMTTHLIYVSEDNRLEAAALGIGPKTPTSLIRSGIEIQHGPWKGAERRNQPGEGIAGELGLTPNTWTVAYVGNFKPQKNPMDLARVAERVVAQAPDVCFVLIGDGEKKKDVEKFVTEHSLERQIKLPGWRRREDVQEILQNARCFLLTSAWEGLPRALVEAFAARLPAVAYAVNGVRDILKEGENGFPIPPGDVERAAEKILWLKAHPDDAKRMGERGRQLVEKEFDIDWMVRQQEELYDKLFQEVPLKEYYKPHGSPTSA